MYSYILVRGPRSGSLAGEVFTGRWEIVDVKGLPFITDGNRYFNLNDIVEMRV